VIYLERAAALAPTEVEREFLRRGGRGVTCATTLAVSVPRSRA
jgi:uncharacterized protein with von Willebrand factor type A (vWA) domain